MEIRLQSVFASNDVKEETYVQLCDKESDKYRFGFNGKVKDNEWAGIGNHIDYGERGYDTRISRFISVDPLTHKFPMLTPYQFCSLNPIMNVDLDGREGLFFGVAEMVEVGGDFTKVGVVSDEAIISRPAPVTRPTPSPGLSEWSVGPGGQFIGPSSSSSGTIGGAQPLLMPRTVSLPQDNLKPQNKPIVSPKTKEEKDDDYITLHRGVSKEFTDKKKTNFYMYVLAEKGVAVPRGYMEYPFMPHKDEEDHAMGDNHSIWTSWTEDEKTAENFSHGTSGTYEGVVLTKRFKKSELSQSKTNGALMQEKEYLVPGVVTGANVRHTKPEPKQ